MTPSSAVLYARLMTGARFRHLQAFSAIAEFGSAQRAADAIGLTQPAVTHLVADLEEFLQCPLFHRHARGMRMTDMARELLPFVQRSLATLEAGTQFVAFRQSSGHSIVRVGAIHGAINGLLVRALPAFGQSKPDILVQLQEANAAESSALISNREVDLMLCREPPVWPEGWEFADLLPDRLVVVAGPNHPLVRKRGLRLPDLLDEMWLMLHPATHARKTFDALMAAHGTAARYRKLEVRSSAMVLAQLQSETLLSFTPYSAMRQFIDMGQIALIDVTDLPALPPLGILSVRDERGEAANTLKEHLFRYARKHP
ncbi:MAG: LysR family transcriptional regulator [Pseudomonadota bacterium]